MKLIKPELLFDFPNGALYKNNHAYTKECTFIIEQYPSWSPNKIHHENLKLSSKEAYINNSHNSLHNTHHEDLMNYITT